MGTASNNLLRSEIRLPKAWLYFAELTRDELREFLNIREIDLLHWRSPLHPYTGPRWRRGADGTGVWFNTHDVLRWLDARRLRGNKLQASPALSILESGKPWPDGKKRKPKKPRHRRDRAEYITDLSNRIRARGEDRKPRELPPEWRDHVPLPFPLPLPPEPVIPPKPFMPAFGMGAAERLEDDDEGELFDWSVFNRPVYQRPQIVCPPLRFCKQIGRRFMVARLPSAVRPEPPPPLPDVPPVPDALPPLLDPQPVFSLADWNSLCASPDVEANGHSLIGFQAPRSNPMDEYRPKPAPEPSPIKIPPKKKRRGRKPSGIFAGMGVPRNSS